MGSKKMENVNLDFLSYSSQTFHKQEVNPESVLPTKTWKTKIFFFFYRTMNPLAKL